MTVVLLGALLALSAVVQVSSSDEKSRSLQCNENPRSVLLETGIHIDLIYCGPTPDISTTVGYQEANSDGKFYTITTHTARRLHEAFPAYIFTYKPNGDWAVPTKSLDTMGAIILKAGDVIVKDRDTDDPGHKGWVVQQDSRFNHQGQDWLSARQITLQKGTAKQWVYYRIILDTRHNMLYVLYQRDDEGGANQENSFFNSFTVDPNRFTPALGDGPGAHLPPPYPNP